MDMKALKMRAEWVISGKNENASARHAASPMEGRRFIDVGAEYADMAGQYAK